MVRPYPEDSKNVMHLFVCPRIHAISFITIFMDIWSDEEALSQETFTGSDDKIRTSFIVVYESLTLEKGYQ